MLRSVLMIHPASLQRGGSFVARAIKEKVVGDLNVPDSASKDRGSLCGVHDSWSHFFQVMPDLPGGYLETMTTIDVAIDVRVAARHDPAMYKSEVWRTVKSLHFSGVPAVAGDSCWPPCQWTAGVAI